VLIARRARISVDDGQAPLLGVMGAFVFAAQMINFPVGLGTSGHLIGSALLTVALGPAAAAAVMTAILAVQAFVFQDGGVLALGANVFNMAIAGTLAAYAPIHFLRRGRLRTVGIAAGAFLSVAVSATLALSELLISGVRMPGPALLTSLGLFAASGVVEAAITIAVVRALERLHPRFVEAPRPAMSRPLAVLGVTAVLLAAIGVLFASTTPDTLESLVSRAGSAAAAKSFLPSLMPDYRLPVGGPEWLRRASAGLAGIALMALISVGLVRLLSRRGARAGGGA
jgi:cobalt/nickel transport system permease protein